MSAVVVFVSLCVLLVAGKFLRVQIPLLQRLYLPSSVIGGVILSVITRLMRLDLLVDRVQMERISGARTLDSPRADPRVQDRLAQRVLDLACDARLLVGGRLRPLSPQSGDREAHVVRIV